MPEGEWSMAVSGKVRELTDLKPEVDGRDIPDKECLKEPRTRSEDCRWAWGNAGKLQCWINCTHLLFSTTCLPSPSSAYTPQQGQAAGIYQEEINSSLTLFSADTQQYTWVNLGFLVVSLMSPSQVLVLTARWPQPKNLLPLTSPHSRMARGPSQNSCWEPCSHF